MRSFYRLIDVQVFSEMSGFMESFDKEMMRKAISVANAAYKKGNLAIGAVISFQGSVVSEGGNAIWYPNFDFTRHAEMEAIRNIPPQLWRQAEAMTLYTTLEPCLMCFGAILLHGIGRVVYGVKEPLAGSIGLVAHLPSLLRQQCERIQVSSGVLGEECEQLSSLVLERLKEHRDDIIHRQVDFGELPG